MLDDCESNTLVILLSSLKLPLDMLLPNLFNLYKKKNTIFKEVGELPGLNINGRIINIIYMLMTRSRIFTT